jgi:hypothetical protein
MNNLADQTNGVFGKVDKTDAEIAKEYLFRNERKKEDEKWLDKVKPVLRKILLDADKDKMDFNGVRIIIQVPDTSKFNNDKLVTFLQENGLHSVLEEVTKVSVNEEALAKAIENGDIDLELLNAAAWEVSFGTPRLTAKQVD